MIQLLPRAWPFVSYIDPNWYFPATAGSPGFSETFGSNQSRCPVPWAAIARSLTVSCHDPLRLQDVTVTIRKNGVDSAMTVVLPLGEERATVTGAIAFAQLDDISYHTSTEDGHAAPGFAMGFSLELESQGNIFGVAAISGGFPDGEGGAAGALGNGGWTEYPAPESGTRSICGCPGSVTKLVLKTHSGPVQAGCTWTGYIRVRRVGETLFTLQDGTGGTPNTACVIAEGETGGVSATFAVPLVVGDECEVVFYRTGDASDFAFAHVAAGIGFTPTIPGAFMMTGSHPVLNTPLDYVWQANHSTTEAIVKVPMGPSGVVVKGLYIERTFPGVDTTYTLRRNEADTLVALTLSGEEGFGLVIRTQQFGPTDWMSIQVTDNGITSSILWGFFAIMEDADTLGNGVIGPLIWVNFPRVSHLSGSGTVVSNAYSDEEMHCPGDYYGGYKEPRLLEAGDAERALSDPFTGDIVASTFQFTLADHGETVGRLRAQLASSTDRYWTEPLKFRMTTRANRAILGQPFLAFAGPVIDAQPVTPRKFAITIGDIVAERMLSDRLQLPWRLIRDGFLDQLDYISERLDLDQPEPILYGAHRREPDVTPPSPQGFRILPIYLGIMTLDGAERHVWLCAGHACGEFGAHFVDGEARTEGSDWWIPHHTNHDTFFGAPFCDFTSSTYGNTRRYSLIFGLVGSDEPDKCALGELQLTVDINGIEDVGDGSGEVIYDIYQQYKHFLINFVANQGPNSYQSGEWLTCPTWDLDDRTVAVIDEASFDTASDIAVSRLYPEGIFGAAAIGIRAGDRSSVAKWMADFNRSGWCQSGQTKPFQYGIVMLHPTEAAKAAAPLYTDAYEILDGSFGTSLQWDRHLTSVPWRNDFEHASGNWKTSGVAPTSEADNYVAKDGPVREYIFAPGESAGNHLATLESRVLANPPRLIRLSATVGPDINDDSLGYRNLGDYIRYVHYDAVAETREERLAQVQVAGVRGSKRECYIVALDCEDLIGFDEPDGSPTSP